MFGLLTTSYLFFGGAGAGALVILSLLECANARRRFGGLQQVARVSMGAPISGRGSRWSTADGPRALAPDGSNRPGFLRWLSGRFALPDELFSRAWPMCFVVLALAVLCLLFDLGRPDRLLNLLLFPTLSPIAVGAYSLVAALIVSCAFSAFSLLDGSRANVLAARLLGALGVAVGLVAAAYTGVLLSGLASILFWQTWWLPAAFPLSPVPAPTAPRLCWRRACARRNWAPMACC